MCTAPSGWAEVAGRGTLYVVFGEVHGTRESPAFVGSLACGLAARGERILVGVELQATDNPALQRAWRLPDDQFAPALRRIGWEGRTDGVGSEAMFRLLQRLHALRSSGRNIDVVAFNGFADEAQSERLRDLAGQGPHEAAQAENIRKAAEGGRYNHVLVLVGNLHARKTPVDDRGTVFEPMAMHLGSAAQVTTLNMRLSQGSMWNCLVRPNAKLERGKPLPPGAVDCGNHQTHDAAVDLGPTPLMSLENFPGEPRDANYDGFYWLGRVNGSPPASSRDQLRQ
jgi:hypothetical protein